MEYPIPELEEQRYRAMFFSGENQKVALDYLRGLSTHYQLSENLVEALCDYAIRLPREDEMREAIWLFLAQSERKEVGYDFVTVED